jgi:hypothetical protein
MPWVKIDDQFHSNPKVVAAGAEAVALYIVALSWCGAYLTDGFIPAGQVRRLALSNHYEEATKRLVEVGLWHEVDGGYEIHDYLEYNPTAEEVKESKQARAEAGRRGGLASVKSRRRAKAQANAQANASANAQANGKQKSTPSPSPSPSPDQNHAEETLSSASADYHEIRLAWSELFPDKPQPRPDNKTLQGKVKTRMRSPHFRDNWRAAMQRASRSTFCNGGPWFDLAWFVKNDGNYEACLSGKYDDKKGNGRGSPQKSDPYHWDGSEPVQI